MKIQIKEIFNCIQGLNLIYENEEATFDGTFDYFMQKQNIPILQKEMQKLQEYDEQQRMELANEYINIPLQKVPADTLPSNIDKGVIMLIDILIDGDIDGTQYQSETDYDAFFTKEEDNHRQDELERKMASDQDLTEEEQAEYDSIINNVINRPEPSSLKKQEPETD